MNTLTKNPLDQLKDQLSEFEITNNFLLSRGYDWLRNKNNNQYYFLIHPKLGHQILELLNSFVDEDYQSPKDYVSYIRSYHLKVGQSDRLERLHRLFNVLSSNIHPKDRKVDEDYFPIQITEDEFKPIKTDFGFFERICDLIFQYDVMGRSKKFPYYDPSF